MKGGGGCGEFFEGRGAGGREYCEEGMRTPAQELGDKICN
jgi:hypothetical protein